MTAQGKPKVTTKSESMILNHVISVSLRAGLGEIADEEGDVTPHAFMDDIEISERGSEGGASDNEEIPEFPEPEDDEGHEMSDLDIGPDVIVPDSVVSDVAVPDLESYTMKRVTQVGCRAVNLGASVLTSTHRPMRGVY
jgi:hypothetical protein